MRAYAREGCLQGAVTAVSQARYGARAGGGRVVLWVWHGGWLDMAVSDRERLTLRPRTTGGRRP